MGNLLADPIVWKFVLLLGFIYAALRLVDRLARRRPGGQLTRFPGNDTALKRWDKAREGLPIEDQVEPVGLLPFLHTTSPEDARRQRRDAARAARAMRRAFTNARTNE